MTRPGMVGFRSAATLAHALPNVCLRIRDEDRVLLEVVRPPLPPGPWPVATPCSFHAAVARAYRCVTAGHRLSFLGMPEQVKLTIDVGLTAGDAVLPGDIYQLTVERGVVHVFPSTLEFRRCQDILADWTPAAASAGKAGAVHVGLHQDPATDITLVYVLSPGDEAALGQELIEELLANFSIAELTEDVAECASPPPMDWHPSG
jgi:hypothetical protein